MTVFLSPPPKTFTPAREVVVTRSFAQYLLDFTPAKMREIFLNKKTITSAEIAAAAVAKISPKDSESKNE